VLSNHHHHQTACNLCDLFEFAVWPRSVSQGQDKAKDLRPSSTPRPRTLLSRQRPRFFFKKPPRGQGQFCKDTLWIGRRDSATCPYCNGADETAEHLVLHCSAHEQARGDIWPGGQFNTDPRRIWDFLERIGNERERGHIMVFMNKSRQYY